MGASPMIKWVEKIKAKGKATGKLKGNSKGKAKGIWHQLRLKAKRWFVKKHNISYSSSSPKGKSKGKPWGKWLQWVRKSKQWSEHGRKKHDISYSSSSPASSTQAVTEGQKWWRMHGIPTKGKSKGKSKGKAEAKWQQWVRKSKQWFIAKGNSQGGNSQGKHELDTPNVLIAKPQNHQTKQVEHDFEVELAAREMADTTEPSTDVSNAKWSHTVANACMGLAILLCMVAAAMLACRRPRIQVITMEDLNTNLVPDKFVVPTQDTTFYTSEVKHVEPEQI